MSRTSGGTGEAWTSIADDDSAGRIAEPTPSSTDMEPERPNRYFLEEYSVAVVGGGGVDKSQLVSRFIHSETCEDFNSEDNWNRRQCIIDNEVAFIEALDSTEPNQFSAQRGMHLTKGQGFVILYSITSRASFEDTLNYQQQILRVKDKDYFPMILVGNHCESENERRISYAEGESLASSWGCPFIEVSSQDALNVEEAFFRLVRYMRAFEREEQTWQEAEQAPLPKETTS